MYRFYFLSCLFLAHFFAALHSHELAIVSIFRNTAPYLKEWVEYHRLVGVDHFWLYNDASTDNWEEVLKPYIDEGLVEVFYWPAGKPDWVPAQMAAFRDGVKRACGTTKWVALIDQDEFLLPMKEKTVPECLRKHFSKASAVYVNWRNFGTSKIFLDQDEPMLTRLTFCSKRYHSRNSTGKSILRPEMAQFDKMWSPHHCPLLPDGKYVNGNAEETLTVEGTDLKPDGKNNDKFLRINHYALRDERYFREYRLPRDANPKLMLQLYRDYNKTQDYAILDYLKKVHPEKYKTFWKKQKAAK